MHSRSFVRALTGSLSALCLLMLASPANAQGTPAPVPPAGHPWYFWLGVVALGMAVLVILQIVAMWVIQARGFDKAQDRRA